jgi:hypothetical protein
MKGLNNELLPEYVKLMSDFVDYVVSPAYHNYYSNYDKKLTKNIVKRCVIEPFVDKFMKKKESQGYEIGRFKEQLVTLNTLHKALITVGQQDLLTDTLKEKLKPALRDYLNFLEADPTLCEQFKEDI